MSASETQRPEEEEDGEERRQGGRRRHPLEALREISREGCPRTSPGPYLCPLTLFPDPVRVANTSPNTAEARKPGSDSTPCRALMHAIFHASLV